MARLATPDRHARLHADAPVSQIHPSLGPRPHDVSVRKTRVGAFSTTNFDEQLTDRGITTLALAGISTSGVVLSTVREAMDRDYRIFVLRTMRRSDPQTHAFLTGVIYPRHTDVIGVDDLRERWT